MISPKNVELPPWYGQWLGVSDDGKSIIWQYVHTAKIKSEKGATDTYQQNQLCEQYKSRRHMPYGKKFLSTLLINGTIKVIWHHPLDTQWTLFGRRQHANGLVFLPNGWSLKSAGTSQVWFWPWGPWC